jgi:5-methyltetrahydropteroyltriglutamate--homocysteine methyltransferase
MTRIKTTHVGSLPRPQQMLTKALRKQEVKAEELRGYVSDVLHRQLALGIDGINNGELPRADYVSSTVARITGFEASCVAPAPRDLEELPELSRRFNGRNGLITLNPKAPIRLPACSKPLAYVGESDLRHELDMLVNLYEAARGQYPETESELFFTSPSPGTIALFMENRYYPSDAEYLEAISEVMKYEYELIAQYGVKLQVDCPDLAMGRHTRFKQLTDDEFIATVATHVRALNSALSGLEAHQVRAHVCWGNYPGTHHCDVELATIFNEINKVDAKYLSLEASNHRHAHEWQVFEKFDFPDDKVLLPGIIDTSSNTVEHPDLVAQRISNYANTIGPERVIASTDCGFATTASATSVSGEVAWLKLASLVEGAKRASARYQGKRHD